MTIPGGGRGILPQQGMVFALMTLKQGKKSPNSGIGVYFILLWLDIGTGSFSTIIPLFFQAFVSFLFFFFFLLVAGKERLLFLQVVSGTESQIHL